MATPANSTPVPDGFVLELHVTETLRGHMVAEQWFCHECGREVVRDAARHVAEGAWSLYLTQGVSTIYNTGRRRRVSHRWVEVDADASICYGDTTSCPIAATHATVY